MLSYFLNLFAVILLLACVPTTIAVDTVFRAMKPKKKSWQSTSSFQTFPVTSP